MLTAPQKPIEAPNDLIPTSPPPPQDAEEPSTSIQPDAVEGSWFGTRPKDP